MNIRIGNGYDVHAFIDGSSITLGGVKIPHHKSFLAHSDGDVLIHALCDAILGALALGDIGKHFPDTDPAYSAIDSRKLLKHVKDLMFSHNYKINNCDCTIVAQQPKMSPYIDRMRTQLAEDLEVAVSKISIKATTTEKLGFVGKKEGIAVYAVVLLHQ